MDQKTSGINEAIGRAMKHADAIDAPVAISIVDDGGHLLAFLRHSKTKLVACTTAVGKARCAVMFSRDSSVTEEMAKLNPVAFQSFVTASELPFTIGSGGYFIDKLGLRIGVGVAGATPHLDEIVGEMIRDQLLTLFEHSSE